MKTITLSEDEVQYIMLTLKNDLKDHKKEIENNDWMLTFRQLQNLIKYFEEIALSGKKYVIRKEGEN